MQLKQLHAGIAKALRGGLNSARSDAPIELETNWILEHYTECTFLDCIKTPEKEIDEIASSGALEAARRASLGEPLAYILGYRDFFGLKFQVSPDVLIPRPETELLVEWALEWLQDHTLGAETWALDLGTGSGCMAIALAKNFKGLKVVAVDLSLEALTIAKSNALAHGVADSIHFIHGDASRIDQILQQLKMPVQFDVIVANPPYIDPEDPEIESGVRQYEPHTALFALGGLSAVQSWLNAAALCLKEHSALGFEIGYRQGSEALKLVRDLGVFSKQYILQDLSDKDRFVCGEKG